MSDTKALSLRGLSSALGRKVDPKYALEDYEWLRQVEECCESMPIVKIEKLRELIQTGPISNPER